MALRVLYRGTHLHGVDVVALREEVEGVGDEDDGLAAVAEGTDDCVGEESLADVRVDWQASQNDVGWRIVLGIRTSRERVVENDDVSIIVECTSNVDLDVQPKHEVILERRKDVEDARAASDRRSN